MDPYVPPMTWWQYVQQVSGTTNQTEIAKKVGLSGPSVSRWRTSAPKPPNAAAFARAYGRPVIEAFIAARFLNPEDVGLDDNLSELHRDRWLAQLDEEALISEVQRRLDEAREVVERDSPIAPYLEADDLELYLIVRVAHAFGRDAAIAELGRRGLPLEPSTENQRALEVMLADPDIQEKYGLSARGKP